MNLPDARPDGCCVDCGRPAVTNDRRFCLKCLRARIRAETSGLAWNLKPSFRSREKRQAGDGDEGSPWHENAVRAMEDSL